MKSNKEILRDFFVKEEKSLQKNYPGLNWRRLESEFEVFFLSISHNPFLNSGLPQKIEDFIDKLKSGIPLEYITHRAYFYKSEYWVNENVLIPRSESELLVEMAVAEIKKKQKGSKNILRIADVATGSGCIGLSIAAELGFPIKLTSTDISAKALEIAKINTFRLRFQIPKASQIHFVETDRLLKVEEIFDVIVSNPPYIKENLDRTLVHDQVDKYEPHLALYLKAEEYEGWFIDFFNMVQSSLKNEGAFLMEGHEDHLNDLAPLAELAGLKDVKILPDLSGRHRFLRGTKLEG